MRLNFLLFFLLFTATLATNAQRTFDPKTRAKESVFLFRSGNYTALYNRMDPTMKRILNEEKIQSFWDLLEMKYGKLQEVGEPTVTEKDTLFITHTPIKFEKSKFGLKLVFDQKGMIAGMFLDAATAQYHPASYVNESLFYEYKKTLPDPKYPADAILSIPAKGNNLPLVIIVGGSGPTDKDLTIGPNKIYKDLAWGLAGNGVSVLRYDKRTLANGAAMTKAKNLTVKEEYLDDLKLAIGVAKKYPEIDTNKIYILGHSEGGYLIPYFEKNLKGIAGYISLAGSYSKLANLMCDQLNYLKESTPKEQRSGFDAMIAKSVYARDKANRNTPDDSLPTGLTGVYLSHLNDNGPENLITYVSNTKLLFLQGGRDYQVPPAEMEKWKVALKNNAKAEYELYPKLNHLALEGKGKSLPAEYEAPGNVPEEIVKRIVRFVMY